MEKPKFYNEELARLQTEMNLDELARLAMDCLIKKTILEILLENKWDEN